jgi:hypothetical protein
MLFTAKRAKASPRAPKQCRGRRRLSAGLLALILMLMATPAFAQGCAMCYQTVKGTPKDGQRALSRAIIILLLPPLGAMTLGVGLAFRYGKNRDREKENDPE